MGSSGIGSFGDYRGGQEPTNDMCRKDIKLVELEEVGRLEYFNSHNDVPTIMEQVVLSDKLENGRLVVLLEKSGEKLGLLPTRYSNLLACMRKGFSYSGTVLYSTLKPFPRIEVDLYANE